jgi:PKD repeat protein
VKTDYITVYAPVRAGFSFNPTTGPAPLLVTFTNESSGDYDTLSWDFGDGSPISSEIDPSHTYETPGNYTITLVASGPGGEDATQSEIIVEEETISYFIYLPLIIH